MANQGAGAPSSPPPPPYVEDDWMDPHSTNYINVHLLVSSLQDWKHYPVVLLPDPLDAWNDWMDDDEDPPCAAA